MSHHIIKTVIVHFMSDILDQVLVGSNDPPVHDVSVGIRFKLYFLVRVVDKVLLSVLFPSGDVLD